MMRLQPVEAAKRFIEQFYPQCNVAFLAGSASRGEHKALSDLDIVIIDETIPSAYRESLFELGWRMEIFINNRASILGFFESDAKRGRPTMPHMCANGILLKDDGTAALLRAKALAIIEQGPEPLTVSEIESARYFLTDLLEDFIDADRHDEALYTLNTLSIQLAEFALRVQGRWIGRGKGLPRMLRQYSEDLNERFVDAISGFVKRENKQLFVQLADDILDPYGGRLFEGFSVGKVK